MNRWACVLLMLWGLPAGAAKLNVNVVVPPNDPIEGVRSIRVARFVGLGGDNLRAWVGEALTDGGRGGVMPRATTLHEGFQVDILQVVTSGGDAVLSGNIDVSERPRSKRRKSRCRTTTAPTFSTTTARSSPRPRSAPR